MLLDLTPATLQFNRYTIYTFACGPNAGREVLYTGPGKHPFEDHVHVITVDGLPFSAPEGKQHGHCTAVCKPIDLVAK